ncbi:MAG: AraC family transcriptional regulator [Alloprevotella sp.]|nr:AraC family transcriptional regulator [Alloprevotella sp.]
MLRQISLSDASPYFSDNNEYALADGFAFIENWRGPNIGDGSMQLGFMLICFCQAGSASLRLHGRPFSLQAGDMLICFGDQILEDCKISADFKAQAAIISQDLSAESFVGLQDLWPYMLYLFNHPVITLSNDEQQWLIESFTLLRSRMRNTKHHYRREVLLSLLRLCYFDVCNFLADRVPANDRVSSRNHLTFDSFINLLQQNYREHREVGWYAGQLNLTPKYLSEVVKQVSGRNASGWINAFVVNELKGLLRSSSLSIKEISRRMNFANQSFLGKYFKSATGLSPAAYRKVNS